MTPEGIWDKPSYHMGILGISHIFQEPLPSGKRLHNHGKDPPFCQWEDSRYFDWAIFNGYVKLLQRVYSNYNYVTMIMDDHGNILITNSWKLL